MFENIERKNAVLNAGLYHISTEEENIVRKYVDSRAFDVDAFINYLNNHEYIDLDIFNKTVRPGGPRWTYLTYLKETKRDQFIKRIHIYFYDLFCKIGEPGLTPFFNGYKKYVDGNGMSDDFYMNEEEKGKLCFEFNFEPLYIIIDKIVYEYKIPIHLVLEYLEKQVGNVEEYWVFNTWYEYIQIVENLNEENCFPNNILYAYNTELERMGKLPIIYTALRLHDRPMCFKTGNILRIAGFFPIDSNGKIVLKWVGVWTENILNSLEEENDNIKEKNLTVLKMNNRLKPALRFQLNIKLGPDSLVLLATEKCIDKDLFEEKKYSQAWEQVYIGNKKIQFDRNAITLKREELKKSIKEVSDDTDINIRTLQRIEAGETIPDGLNLLKLMDYYDFNSYSDLVRKYYIEDNGYEKFRSGKPISYFLNNELQKNTEIKE